MGMVHGRVPSSVSAHAEAGEVDSLAVYFMGFQYVIHKGNDVARIPALPGGTLRGKHDEFEVGIGLDDLGRAVFFDFLNVASSFAGAVKEHNHRQRFCICVAVRQVEQIIQRPPNFKTFCLLLRLRLREGDENDGG